MGSCDAAELSGTSHECWECSGRSHDLVEHSRKGAQYINLAPQEFRHQLSELATSSLKLVIILVRAASDLTMKTLMRWVLERAGNSGGEEWLRWCLDKGGKEEQ